MAIPAGWAVLTEAYNDVEADILVAVLRSRDIPAEKREKGFLAGMRVIMGQAYGIDVLVPERLLAEAREALRRAEEEAAASDCPED